MKKRLDNLLSKLKKRYRVSVLENDTFSEKGVIVAPFWCFLSWMLAGFILFVLLISILIKYSPLSEYLIGDENYQGRQELVQAYSRIDSLSEVVQANDAYLNNIKNVMQGTVGETVEEVLARERLQDTQAEVKKNRVDPSVDEQILQNLLAGGGVSLNNEKAASSRGISSYIFYSPVRGIISGQYDSKTQHFATDIATKLNDPIKSILDGHVIFASYTPATGYVIIIQHADNLISVYKHCATLLKKTGSFVRGGEVIAMVGNTGELSTGPHLHFELWYQGSPLNAEDYITF